jgi:chromosome segregation ATPase
MEKEITLRRQENSEIVKENQHYKQQIRGLEQRLVEAEAANASLQRQCDAHVDVKSNLENELDQKELMLSDQKKQQKRTVQKYQAQISQERNVNAELVEKVKEQQEQKLGIQDVKEKLRQVSHIVNGQNRQARPRTRLSVKPQSQLPDTTTSSSLSDADNPTSSAHQRSHQRSLSAKRIPIMPNKSNSNISTQKEANQEYVDNEPMYVPVSNIRHRRSQSAGQSWIDHQPGRNEPPIVKKSTIMQPTSKGRHVKHCV